MKYKDDENEGIVSVTSQHQSRIHSPSILLEDWPRDEAMTLAPAEKITDGISNKFVLQWKH